MYYLYTKYQHYSSFIETYKNDRLSKNLKLMCNTIGGELIKEIFNSPLETKYKIEEYSPNILISFYTKSEHQYRLDIFQVNEIDKSNQFINHIAFSDYSKDLNNEEEYEELLGRNEMNEILNRIHFILKDLVSNQIINNHFCIGGAKLEKKNKIYRYMLKVLLGDEGFQKLDTNIYSTGFGLYFKI